MERLIGAAAETAWPCTCSGLAYCRCWRCRCEVNTTRDILGLAQALTRLYRRRCSVYLHTPGACSDHSAHNLRAHWLFEIMGGGAGPGPLGDTTVQRLVETAGEFGRVRPSRHMTASIHENRRAQSVTGI